MRMFRGRSSNIIRFIEVFLTPTHLAIVMEYAAGGELFSSICNAGHSMICNFGYSKSGTLNPNQLLELGTPGYIAPEVLSRKEYNGKVTR